MQREGDLTDAQINQVCGTILSRPNRPFGGWIAGATERFVLRVRPWIPLWVCFAQWSVNWCVNRKRERLFFLARDMLSTYLTARELDQQEQTGLDLRLVHADRSEHSSVRKVFDLKESETFAPGSLALVDSGCYGAIVSRLAEQLTSPNDGSAEDPACLFFFSRNPRIFGFLNYLLSPAILEADVAGHDVVDFIIYAGDLLESLPKPYRVVERDGELLGELQDPLTFCLSMAALSEIHDYVRAGPMPTVAQAQRRALDLYDTYAHAAGNRVLTDSLLFSTRTPKHLPESCGFPDQDFRSFPPQNEIFGPMAG